MFYFLLSKNKSYAEDLKLERPPTRNPAGHKTKVGWVKWGIIIHYKQFNKGNYIAHVFSI
jgi:hypothetical protein